MCDLVLVEVGGIGKEVFVILGLLYEKNIRLELLGFFCYFKVGVYLRIKLILREIELRDRS